tara:strand:+ start:1077 stop:1286 length:210 start_codon:yes stop_codon:yes gene_type:complete
LIKIEATLTKKEFELLKASILVHLEFATHNTKDGRNKNQLKMGRRLLDLCHKLNIETEYEKDFFKEEDI